MENGRDAGGVGLLNGFVLLPDVSLWQHDEERSVRQACLEVHLSRQHCAASNHICFYSKLSGADTAGSLSLLLKSF